MVIQRLFYGLLISIWVIVNSFRPLHVPESRPRPLLAEKSGYQFGDISRFLARRATQRIQQVTGKSDYEFGDLTRWLDQQAKEKVTNLTGKTDYEFGDLTRWVDQSLKERVTNYTGKTDYAFGDITKRVITGIQNGEYDLADVYLALRILLSAGAGLTPVASILPIKWLWELVNLGLAQDLAGRLLQVLAANLDERMKEALTGDAKYQLGDISKRKVQESIARFTGKDRYEFGDIARAVASMSEKKATTKELDLEDDAEEALREWDRRFLENQDVST